MNNYGSRHSANQRICAGTTCTLMKKYISLGTIFDQAIEAISYFGLPSHFCKCCGYSGGFQFRILSISKSVLPVSPMLRFFRLIQLFQLKYLLRSSSRYCNLGVRSFLPSVSSWTSQLTRNDECCFIWKPPHENLGISEDSHSLWVVRIKKSLLLWPLLITRCTQHCTPVRIPVNTCIWFRSVHESLMHKMKRRWMRLLLSREVDTYPAQFSISFPPMVSSNSPKLQVNRRLKRLEFVNFLYCHSEAQTKIQSDGISDWTFNPVEANLQHVHN